MNIPLAVIWSISALHKAQLVATGQARWLALFVNRPAFRRASPAILLIASLADIFAALLLAITPSVGASISTALIVMYTAVSLPNDRNVSCNCFGLSILDAQSRETLVMRNIGLIAASVLVVTGRRIGALSAAVALAALFAIAWGIDELRKRQRVEASNAFDSATL